MPGEVSLLTKSTSIYQPKLPSYHLALEAFRTINVDLCFHGEFFRARRYLDQRRNVHLFYKWYLVMPTIRFYNTLYKESSKKNKTHSNHYHQLRPLGGSTLCQIHILLYLAFISHIIKSPYIWRPKPKKAMRTIQIVILFTRSNLKNKIHSNHYCCPQYQLCPTSAWKIIESKCNGYLDQRRNFHLLYQGVI